jgi:hypothetical protein
MTDSTSHSMQDSVDPSEPDPDFIKWLKENCVPIVGMIFGALSLCLVAHYSSITVDWTRTREFTEALTNIIQSLALVAGGVWAYFKFAKGRTFQDRLIPTVNGKFVLVDESLFLVVSTQIKNVGLANIAFNPKASTVTVFEFIQSETEEILRVVNTRLTSFSVFGDNDKNIEPNEIAERKCLIALPRVSLIGYQLEFEVFSDSGCSWRTTTIVDTSLLRDNEN